jgi:hypothetical protein
MNIITHKPSNNPNRYEEEDLSMLYILELLFTIQALILHLNMFFISPRFCQRQSNEKGFLFALPLAESS